jgi:hypothetical protein
LGDERKQVSASQRRKGQVGERELFKRLSEDLGICVKRNVDQARNGGADCLELPGYAVECKRCERLSKPAWWHQAVKQGQESGREAIVFYRQSRKDWRALVTADGGFKDVSWDEAMDVIRDKLARLFAIYPKMKDAA